MALFTSSIFKTNFNWIIRFYVIREEVLLKISNWLRMVPVLLKSVSIIIIISITIWVSILLIFRIIRSTSCIFLCILIHLKLFIFNSFILLSIIHVHLYLLLITSVLISIIYVLRNSLITIFIIYMGISISTINYKIKKYL